MTFYLLYYLFHTATIFLLLPKQVLESNNLLYTAPMFDCRHEMRDKIQKLEEKNIKSAHHLIQICKRKWKQIKRKNITSLITKFNPKTRRIKRR